MSSLDKLLQLSATLKDPRRDVCSNLLSFIEQDVSSSTQTGMYKGKDLGDFYKILQMVIDAEQQLNNVGAPIFFRQYFTPFDYGEDTEKLKKEFFVNERNSNDVITAKLLRRTPGSTKQSNVFHDKRRRQVKPALFDIVKDEEYSGYKKLVYGQYYDNTVELVVWSLQNKRADHTAIWLEDLLNKWDWYFNINGIYPIVYEGRGEDNAISGAFTSDINLTKEIRLFSRPLVYAFRTEKLIVKKEKELEKIIINLSKKEE